MNSFELLAPAGSYDAFMAAIENGADAIYLGGKLFNARANASNFTLEELRDMIEFAHLRNVKIHVTLNTLLDDREIKEALDFAYDLYNIGVDAVIVQDLGLAKVLHENIPNLALHASTQMSIYNLEGVEKLKELGFSRVVLARELNLEEIKYICDNTDMEIEIFVHGALCVCYSGQCLMSSMIGDRSGNRGKCAQPCRMPYSLIRKSLNTSKEEICSKGYLLSPKDLCTIDYLNELPNVTSLKIEGRMKSPEYVATVVSSYKKILNNLSSDNKSEIKNNLMQVFNRGGFTDAYHHKKQGKDMMCYEKPKHWGTYVGKVTYYDGKKYIRTDNYDSINIGDGIEIWNGENESPSTIVSELTNGKIGRITGNIHIGDKVYKTYDKVLMQKAKESFSRNSTRKQLVDVALQIKVGLPIIIMINNYELKTSFCPEEAKKNPLSEEKIIEQFSKTGNTPFEIRNIKMDLGPNVFLPISTINDIRRNAFKLYEEHYMQLIKKEKVLKVPLKEIKKVERVNQPKSISLLVRHISQELDLILPKVDYLYVPLREVLEKEDIFKNLECKKYILLPTITKNKYKDVIKKNLNKLISMCDGFVLSSICQLDYFTKNDSTELIANYTFNTFNSYAIETLKNLGFKKVILSPELTTTQINNISSSISTELLVYGNQCIMTSEYCPIGSIIGGFSKEKKCDMPCTKNDIYYLKDRLGFNFRIIPDNIECQSTLFNSKITSIESKNVIVDSVLISCIDESIKEISQIIDTHQVRRKVYWRTIYKCPFK